MVLLLAALHVITPHDAFGGLGSGSVVGLAFLAPIASAIEETGLLEKSMGYLLGSPKSFIVAMLRMLFLVAILSAFLSNTAIVQMMIPILISWSRQLNVNPGKMMMP